jgi:hypothetical protein
LSDAGGNALAVDFSRTAGVDGLFAVLGEVKAPTNLPGTARQTTLDVGGTKVTVLTLTRGEHPTPTVAGSAVVVGGQVITVDGTQLRLKSLPTAP